MSTSDFVEFKTKHSTQSGHGVVDCEPLKTSAAIRCTIGMRFVDTNVLIYAVSAEPREAEKTKRALALLDEPDLALSVQVLEEFYVQATRSDRTGALTHDEAVLFITSLTRFQIQEMTLRVLYTAFDHKQRFDLSFWDCAILAAAETSGCSEVYSENFSHGQNYGGMRVVNPF